MAEQENDTFDPTAFPAHAGLGRRIVQLKTREAFFSQGSAADAIFFFQKGRAKLTVVSAAVVGRRLATATAITAWYSAQD